MFFKKRTLCPQMDQSGNALKNDLKIWHLVISLDKHLSGKKARTMKHFKMQNTATSSCGDCSNLLCSEVR